MASYVKSVGLLVIIVAVLCSPVHGGYFGFRNILGFRNIFKTPKKVPTKTPFNNPRPPLGNVPRAPRSHIDFPEPPNVPTKPRINSPRAPRGNNPPAYLQTAQEFGLSLAQEYFGDETETIKDFRWGYNQGKLIQSAAQKCTKALNFTSCPQVPQPSPLSPESAPQPQPSPLSPEGAPQPQPSPLSPEGAPQPQPSSLSPERAIYCIVEVTDSENGKCGQQYESHMIPPEATCELDNPDELNAMDCVRT